MAFKVSVSVTDNTKKISKAIHKNLSNAMTDVVLDLKRVASMSAPHAKGFLEKNAEHSVSVTEDKLEGSVGFSAIHKGFNYAEFTHDKKYKLGDKSRKKKGGKSKFGSGIVPVGKGYLKNSLDNNKKGYEDHLREAFKEAIE